MKRREALAAVTAAVKAATEAQSSYRDLQEAVAQGCFEGGNLKNRDYADAEAARGGSTK
jgi:hypothetical protein